MASAAEFKKSFFAEIDKVELRRFGELWREMFGPRPFYVIVSWNNVVLYEVARWRDLGIVARGKQWPKRNARPVMLNYDKFPVHRSFHQFV